MRLTSGIGAIVEILDWIFAMLTGIWLANIFFLNAGICVLVGIYHFFVKMCSMKNNQSTHKAYLAKSAH